MFLLATAGSEIDSGGDSGGSSSKSGKRSLLQESVERALSRPQVVVPSGPAEVGLAICGLNCAMGAEYQNMGRGIIPVDFTSRMLKPGFSH